MKLLIVDDDRMIRNAISEYLVGIGYYVDTAGNATSAMESIESNHYDVMITDLYMRDLGYDAENGLYLLKYVKQHMPHVELIVMSGDPFIETSLTPIKYGVFYFFSKPFSLDALKDKIDVIRNTRFNELPVSPAAG